MLVTVIGKGADGLHKTVHASLLDNEGQTHLTALGGVIQVERALSLGDNAGIHPGVTFPEHYENIDIALATLKNHGVKIIIKS